MTVEPYIAPLSGELLDAEADPDRFDAAVDATWAEIDRLWAAVMPLQDLRTAHRKVHMPAGTARTALQDRALRCPRCRGRYVVGG